MPTPDTSDNLCGTCGYFALEPFKKRSGACLGSYDVKTATYHATSYHRAEKDCWWCPGWLNPSILTKKEF